MEIVVRGRHTDVTERFREHATEKLTRLDRLDHKVARLDVEISREHNPRQSAVSDRVELTCHSRGPVIRAEAAAPDPYAALDLAVAKLQARLRRAADRRRVHHGSRTPVSVAAALAPLAAATARTASPDRTAGTDETDRPTGVPAVDADGTPEASPDGTTNTGPDGTPDAGPDGATGLVVREKVHRAEPMTMDQALFEMELVGHDFFLFVDAATDGPSVVYRRRGYAYGVIRLEA